MIPLKPIFIFDLHNTLYDEVIEYGGAITAAIEYFLTIAKNQKVTIDETLLCRQLSDAHARAGSDWDDDVWYDVAEIQKLKAFKAIIKQAVALRRETSKNLTRAKTFKNTLDAIVRLKQEGASIYVATEATENAASDAIRWLGLDGILDGVYAWPFKKSYQKTKVTPIFPFPLNPYEPELSLQKPHPLILGTIILDIAKIENRIPKQITAEEVFDFKLDEELNIHVLRQAIEDHKSSGQQKRQVKEILRAIQTKLCIKKGIYQSVLEETQKRCFYVGDSFFKDGFLARNADVPFIFAQYGKTVSKANKEVHKKNKDWLFRVTGWDKFLIKLTQEAERLPKLTDKIKPSFVCKRTFQEFVDFLEANVIG